MAIKFCFSGGTHFYNENAEHIEYFFTTKFISPASISKEAFGDR